MENPEPPLLEIQNATIWRGSTRVFHEFSLTINQHERVAIIGPNGSGKTTLLKALNRELFPVYREDSWLKILGRTNWNVWDLRRDIGLVSHDLQQDYISDATVFETVLSGFYSSMGVNTKFMRAPRGEELKRVAELMISLSLEDIQDREYGSLSTGQQRRCLLGRALVHEPHTLIMDEPTSGLDFTAAIEFVNRVRVLVNEGRSLVFVTHHLNEIPPEVDRVIVLKNGTIAADGAKHEVLTDELLSDVYGIGLKITRAGEYYLASPA